MKIATTIGEMYSYTSNEYDAVPLYKDSGFRYLDYNFWFAVLQPNHPLMGKDWKEWILKAKEAADQLGFQFVQAHAPRCTIHKQFAEEEVLATTRSIEACSLLGVKNMVIHTGFFEDIKYPNDQQAYFEINKPFFQALIPAMEKFEVNILFENSSTGLCKLKYPDGCYFPIRGKDLNALVEFMDHPLFGTAWDVGHAHMDGLDHYTEIMEMGKNLKAIHVHDNDVIVDRHMAPFTGTVDYDSLMRGLIESGYNGYFTLESDAFFKRDRSDALTGPLAHTPLEVKKAALSLMYTISKSILSAYDLYEE